MASLGKKHLEKHDGCRPSMWLPKPDSRRAGIGQQARPWSDADSRCKLWTSYAAHNTMFVCPRTVFSWSVAIHYSLCTCRTSAKFEALRQPQPISFLPDMFPTSLYTVPFTPGCRSKSRVLDARLGSTSVAGDPCSGKGDVRWETTPLLDASVSRIR